MALKEDYKDAVFAGLRKYKMLDNGDGTVSPVDMTEYEAAGDKFGAKDVNAITKMVNCTGDAFDPGRDYEVGDYTIYDNTVWKFTTAHPAGEWDESHVEKTRILVEIAEQNKNFDTLSEKLFPDYANSEVVLQPILNGAPYTVIEDAYYQLGMAGSGNASATLSNMKIDDYEALVMLCAPAYNRALCVYPIKRGSVITCASQTSGTTYFFINKIPFRK